MKSTRGGAAEEQRAATEKGRRLVGQTARPPLVCADTWSAGKDCPSDEKMPWGFLLPLRFLPLQRQALRSNTNADPIRRRTVAGKRRVRSAEPTAIRPLPSLATLISSYTAVARIYNHRRRLRLYRRRHKSSIEPVPAVPIGSYRESILTGPEREDMRESTRERE